MHIDSLAVTGSGLTPRQLTVITLLSDGQSAKQIAVQLGISARTVDNHIAAARHATKTNNVTALVAKAIRQKWIF